MAASSVSGGMSGVRRMAERIRTEMRAARAKQPPSAFSFLRSLHPAIIRQPPGLILLNKPPGLAVHGGPGVERSVASMLPELSRMLFGGGDEPLRVCHRLDKDTSGAMLLARSAEAAEEVQRALREHRMQRLYWALCVGIPDPPEGILDIPIIEREMPGPQKHFKMALCPRFGAAPDGSVRRMRVSRSAHEAVTQYRLLGHGAGVSLLELQPITGVKHQLRVHLAQGLSCPILGDHKYSHGARLAPQRPPPAALRALGLAAPKARHLLLHLHAAQLTLQLSPEGEEQGAEPLVLRCPPPKHFRSALRRLRIPPPYLPSLAQDRDAASH